MSADVIRAFEIAAVVVSGTMTGNEIAVAAFLHPRISRLEDDAVLAPTTFYDVH